MKEELYRLANHIASAKGGLPQGWQDWASEIEMDIRKLANREAQPVAIGEVRLGQQDDVGCFPSARVICLHEQADWDNFPDGTKLYTAPPAPAYPERLPCPVHMLPGLKFGKGVPTRNMLDALVRRAEYEAELDAMTPEQKAENDARLDKLKELIPQQAMARARALTNPPAPAVPDKATPGNIEILASGYSNGTFQLDDDEANLATEIWNACRAAMLAQPVSQRYTFNSPEIPDGWKLVPVEPTEDMIAAAMNCDDVEFNSDETFCVNFDNIYAAMLAAAPEGGNG